jgi:hypothetical protein
VVTVSRLIGSGFLLFPVGLMQGQVKDYYLSARELSAVYPLHQADVRSR